VAVTTSLSSATPADALIELSEQVDFLVVGSRGLGGTIASGVLGSVSDRVAAHAHCPVAIVPERIAPRPVPPRVVVGLSSIRSGWLALELAFEEARLSAARRADRAGRRAEPGHSSGPQRWAAT
jgi:hypothetical protein